jgi:D-threo-aldose 1-dehydrogenase
MAEDPLKLRKIGRTDMVVTRLSLGGVGVGGGRSVTDDATGADTLRHTWERGITYVDTSPLYWESEQRIGLSLRQMGGRPAGLYISTKVGAYRTRRGDFSAEATRATVENSLRVMGLDSVDMVLAHSPESMEAVMAPGAALDELERMRDEGKLRWIGVGVQGLRKLRVAIRSGRFDAFLHFADYNLLRQDAQSVIEEAAVANVGVILGHVYLAGLLAGQDPAERSGGRGVPPRFEPDVPLARDWWLWARERGVSLRSVALQFVLRNPLVDVVLVGASTPEQVDGSLAAARDPIPDEIWAEVEERVAQQAKR